MKKLISITAIAILSLGMFGCSQPQANKANDAQTDTTVTAKTESDNSSENSTEAKNQEDTEAATKSQVTTNSGNSSDTKTEGSPNQHTSSQSKSNTKTNSANSSESRSQTKSNSTKQSRSEQLEAGTVKSIVQGDIICYVTLLDEQGKTHEVSASFDICAKQDTFLNQKVRLTYEVANLNDCESAEPCGKTRQETIISKMEIIEENSQSSTQKKGLQTLSNGKWTVTIGNGQPWNGVNGTGNLSYNGCDSQGKCLKLEGGKVSCREGKCIIDWRNGDYSYIIEQPITNPDSPSSDSTTLTVLKGNTVILKETGFKEV